MIADDASAGTPPAGPRLVGVDYRLHEEERRAGRSGHLATGTLACPACDAPVALAAGPVSPADAIACPVCDRAGAVRDFLSLAAPSRPARVEVRVVRRDSGRTIPA
jgi:hypothetical protein